MRARGGGDTRRDGEAPGGTRSSCINAAGEQAHVREPAAEWPLRGAPRPPAPQLPALAADFRVCREETPRAAKTVRFIFLFNYIYDC